MKTINRNITLILLFVVGFAIALIAGFLFGIGKLSFRVQGITKMDSIFSLVSNYYVDSIDYRDMEEKSINSVLSVLDPHTVYLTAKENDFSSQALIGGFSGIGVQFNTLKDTVIVVKVLEGGPAERAGLQTGDRILKADTTSLLNLSTDSIMMALKGKKHSVVTLSLIRKGEPLSAKVVRDDVPVNTIISSYMITPDILYIRFSEWGLNTHKEFLQAYNKVKDKVKGIIIDVRDNPGGILTSAINISNEFLPDGKLLLYAEGKRFKREDYYSQDKGLLINMPLVVLVNENSASASEIFAGIMQDYDRATIIGRRTFGKGLVQEPFQLKDNSVVRLTVARYYIPSGRSIQKDYKGLLNEYENDIANRYYSGELSGKEEFHPSDSTKYYTEGGRIVYGGGGISPDIFVPIDSTGITSYYLEVNRDGLVEKFAFDYTDSNRNTLDKYKTVDELGHYLNNINLLNPFSYYAEQKGIKAQYHLINKSGNRLNKQINRSIISSTLGTNQAIEYTNKTDDIVQKAIEIIRNNKWAPTVENRN